MDGVALVSHSPPLFMARLSSNLTIRQSLSQHFSLLFTSDPMRRLMTEILSASDPCLEHVCLNNSSSRCGKRLSPDVKFLISGHLFCIRPIVWSIISFLFFPAVQRLQANRPEAAVLSSSSCPPVLLSVLPPELPSCSAESFPTLRPPHLSLVREIPCRSLLRYGTKSHSESRRRGCGAKERMAGSFECEGSSK